MAKLYIKREADGTWRVRGQRLAGKELKGHMVKTGVKRSELHAAVEEVISKVAPPKQPSAGE